MFIFIWLFLLSLAISLMVFPYFLSFLATSGLKRKNFRGVEVYVSGGIVIVFVLLVVLGTSAILNFFIAWQEFSELALWLEPLVILVLGVGFLGLTDDVFGNRDVGGFKGHFSRLKEGELTSGVLKAVGIGVLSFFVVASFSANWVLLIINSLLVAFSVNVLNLLDLRPGRSIKMFLVFGALLFAFSYTSHFWRLWGILIGTIPVLFYADLKEKCMMGDVGSNILGAVLGFSLVINTGLIVKVVLLGLLLLIQLYSEKYSISGMIAKVTPLRWFDELGRKPG